MLRVGLLRKLFHPDGSYFLAGRNRIDLGAPLPHVDVRRRIGANTLDYALNACRGIGSLDGACKGPGERPREIEPGQQIAEHEAANRVSNDDRGCEAVLPTHRRCDLAHE